MKSLDFFVKEGKVCMIAKEMKQRVIHTNNKVFELVTLSRINKNWFAMVKSQTGALHWNPCQPLDEEINLLKHFFHTFLNLQTNVQHKTMFTLE